jgi:TolA-binding protein
MPVVRIARIGAVVLALGLAASFAQTQTETDREFEFARRLIDAGFPDYAERLIDEMVRTDASLRPRAQVTRVDILGARGRFEEAEKMLADLPADDPKAQASRLVLAKRYYAARNQERAQALFRQFFTSFGDKPPTDPDLRREYQDASYQYGQMMENFGSYAEAAQAYLRILKTDIENDIARRIRSETASLLVRAARTADSVAKRDDYLKKAYTLCEQIQWDPKGSPDLWFVNSIVTQAMIEYARGNPKAAERMVRQNLDLISGVDELLREMDYPLALSPVAPARFILGDTSEKEGEALLAKDKTKAVKLLAAALQQYVNVYAKYGASDWGPEAGDRAEKLFGRLIELGVRVQPIDFGKFAAEAVRGRKQQADNAFLRGNHEEAARLYFSLASGFPNAVAPMFANLTVSLAQADNRLYLDATVEHIAERYAHAPEAGLGLLSAAKFYFDGGKTNDCVALYRRYVDAFPKTDRTAAILFLLARMLEGQDRAAEAEVYYERLVKDFKEDRNYLLALQQMGQARHRDGEYARAIELFRAYIADSLPTPARATVQALLADSYYRIEDYPNAVREYRLLAQWLENPDQNPYAKTGEDVARARRLYESARFLGGYALTRIREPADRVPRLREQAIQELTDFIARHPKSEFAPRSLYIIGATQLELERTQEAAEAFDRLARDYPETDEGRNAGVALVLAALDIGKMDLARSTLQGMLQQDPPGSPPARFSAAQWATVGARLFDAGLDDEAAQVLGKVVLAPGSERAVRERTLHDLGVVLYRKKDYAGAIKHLEDLLTSYPNSALFFSAKLMLGRAYRDAGQFDDAITALRDVFEYAKDPVIREEANLVLARLQLGAARQAKAEGRAEDADRTFRQSAASFRRTVDFADEKNKELLPLIESAAFEVIAVFEEMERFTDAVRSADVYLRRFGSTERAADVRSRRNALILRAGPAPDAPAPAEAPGTPAPPEAPVPAPAAPEAEAPAPAEAA